MPREPVDVAEGGRGLLVVQALSAQVGSFSTGGTGAQAHVVWCGLGKPLDVAAADAWVWLASMLAAVNLAAPGSRGVPCPSIGPLNPARRGHG